MVLAVNSVVVGRGLAMAVHVIATGSYHSGSLCGELYC